MATKLNATISGVRITFSIFPSNGYQQDGFDFKLMDETMLILSTEENNMVDWGGPDHCDPYITLAYDTLQAATDFATDDCYRLRARAVELYKNCVARKAKADEYSIAYDKLDECVGAHEVGAHEEMERLHILIDAHSPYDFGDTRNVQELFDVVAENKELDFRQES